MRRKQKQMMLKDFLEVLFNSFFKKGGTDL